MCIGKNQIKRDPFVLILKKNSATQVPSKTLLSTYGKSVFSDFYYTKQIDDNLKNSTLCCVMQFCER